MGQLSIVEWAQKQSFEPYCEIRHSIGLHFL